jgi:hypothetical protein
LKPTCESSSATNDPSATRFTNYKTNYKTTLHGTYGMHRKEPTVTNTNRKPTDDRTPDVKSDNTDETSTSTKPNRVNAEGHVNTEVPAHAANSQTNVSFIDVEGERSTLPYDEYIKYAEENNL